ncbi:MAG: hypothetical protein JWR16_555 [Nevskia sp.]|nr:hypothetical protein [Nevskia sp.]
MAQVHDPAHMQNSLFGEAEDVQQPAAKRNRRAESVGAQTPDPAHAALAATLPTLLRLGTSSWNYPGWAGLVWDRDYPEAKLSKHGLRAYAQHPLLRTVSLDRAFYRPLTVDQYAAYAAKVPEHFRFLVKAPSLVADAMIRNDSGRGQQINPNFLDPERAVHAFVEPALAGLGRKLGALVFQLSPLPPALLARPEAVLERLGAMLQALPKLDSQTAPDGVIAVELRDATFLAPDLAPQLIRALREGRATYCLGLHAKMPPIGEQLPILRALWPGPLVCRWNLHRRHGAYGYETAKRLYGAFDKIVDADPETRQTLARVIAGATGAGHPAYVTIGNKAEGSAPLSVAALAEAVVALCLPGRDGLRSNPD